jgi:hypothetical protein
MMFFARPPSIARLIESDRSPPLHASAVPAANFIALQVDSSLRSARASPQVVRPWVSPG